ncbi:MAG: outer membrane beta-barrel protein [Nitrospirota bacterium]|nr:MAG: outer membrane beta-barrel protein [Nitrospirota bacterium]
MMRKNRTSWVKTTVVSAGHSSLLCLGIGFFLLVALVCSAEAGEEGPTESLWEFGGYVDLGYTLDFNFPDNHQWRSKPTTPRVNELSLNIAQAYLRKPIKKVNRWGFEFGVQTGQNSKGLVGQALLGSFESDIPLVGGADVLRHFSHLNASYLFPVNRGLRFRFGLSNSYIGYENFYAKENFNYTRTYIADFSPYFMFDADVQYPVSDNLTTSFYLLNGFFHLSNPSGLPSYGARLDWKITRKLRFRENFFWGPVQDNIDPEFWRLFFDQFLEWNKDQLTLALAYDIGTQIDSSAEGHPRVFWMGGAFYSNWKFLRLWSVAARPEFYWDPQGTISGNRQLLWAITTTAKYVLPVERNNIFLWWEYRYGRSTGSGGGFFKGGDVEPGVPGLAPDHHLLIWAVNWAFDS